MSNWKRKRLHRSEKGYALPFALGVVIIFLIAGGALITFEANELNMLVHHYDSRRAYYLAEAGINHALWELNNNGDGNASGTITVGNGNGTYSTTYNQSVLTSAGTFNGVDKTITVRVSESTQSDGSGSGGSGFGETAAIFADMVNTVPAKTTIWNGHGDTEPNRAAAVNSQNSTLTINGYILNYNQSFGGSDYIGWAYSGGGLQPDANIGTHFRVLDSYDGLLFPIFDSTDYDTMLAEAKNKPHTVLGSSVTGSQILSPGIYYREGDLTISNATIQTDSSATRDNPVYIVVTKNLTVASSTIGVANPSTLADPSQSPSSSNPYGNWIRVLVMEGATFTGTIDNRTTLNTNTLFYNQSVSPQFNDYVTTEETSIYSGKELKMESSTGSPWETQNSNTNNDLNGVSFADSSNGIAVGTGGSTGIVRFTTNGGNTWSSPSSLPQGVPPLLGISFPAVSDAWAVGTNGNIWHSSDRGDNWVAQTSNTSQILKGVSFANTSAGIVVGNNGTIRYTVNGGSGWQTPTSVPSGSPTLAAVSFPTTSQSWVVGSGGVIWKTTDGGKTWTSQSSGTSQNLTGVSFVDANNGWVVGADNTILRTADGGTSWNAQNSGNYGGNFQAIEAFSSYQALGVGTYANSTSALHTTNGGYTWDGQTMPSSFSSTLNGVSFVDQLNGWAVGSGGKILKYTGPNVYLKGTFLVKGKAKIGVNSGGGEIWVEGAIIAGYRYPDPKNPDNYISTRGQVEFGQGSHLIDLIFNRGVMPEVPGDISETTSASLDYSTWREK